MSPTNQNMIFCTEEPGVTGEKAGSKYRYKVFGLCVASDILLPELLPDIKGTNTPQVNICLGNVPAAILGSVVKTENVQIAENQLLFQVPGVGCYYVTKGNSIVVQPAEQANKRFIRLFLLGTAFGALLMQRAIFPVHGSAILINGGCVVFTGVSGAGKSSLLAAFRERGYSFLTDDVAAVTLDVNGNPWVQPAYPQQKLWRDSAEALGIDTVSLASVYTGVNKDKFTVPVYEKFWQSPAPLLAIYELETERRGDVILSSLSSMDKLAILMSHTYRSWLLNGLGLQAAHFKHCAAVAGHVAIARLIRPEGVFSLKEQVRLIELDVMRLLVSKGV